MWRGLLYQLGPPSPEAFAELSAEVALAEAVALDAVWCLPHARTDERSGSEAAAPAGRDKPRGARSTGWAAGAPALWLAALGGSTERIRLGWGVPGLWPPAEPPVREAEHAASLDGASSGRLDLALLPDAFEAAAPEDAEIDEGARMLAEMWAPETFSWSSARHRVPPVDVVPKPRQRPHPPLWLAGWTAGHAAAAGRAGLRFLDVSGGGRDAWQAQRHCYAAARVAAKPDTLLGPAGFAVAIDPGDGVSGAEPEAEVSVREQLAALEADGVDGVLVQARPRGGDHAAVCRRVRWLAER